MPPAGKSRHGLVRVRKRGTAAVLLLLLLAVPILLVGGTAARHGNNDQQQKQEEQEEEADDEFFASFSDAQGAFEGDASTAGAGESSSNLFGSDLGFLNAMRALGSPIDACTPNATCAEGWEDEVAAVGAIYVTSPPEEYCTGTLINGPDGKPYLLTAYHCWLKPGEQQVHLSALTRLRESNLVFEYQSRCKGSDKLPTIRMAVKGFELIAYEDVSDMLLLRPFDPLPTGWGLYLAGVDARRGTVTDKTKANLFHHPMGTPKKWSKAVDGGVYNLTSCRAVNDGDEKSEFCPNTHFMINWSKGFTYPGSSGSALMDSASRRIVGTLTGDTAASIAGRGGDPCDGSALTGRRESIFARLSTAWNFFVRAFPGDENSLTTDGKEYTLGDDPGIVLHPHIMALDPTNKGASINITIGAANHEADGVKVKLQVVPLPDLQSALNDGQERSPDLVAQPRRVTVGADQTATASVSLDTPWEEELPQAGFLRFTLLATAEGSSGEEVVLSRRGFLNPRADSSALRKFDTPLSKAEARGEVDKFMQEQGIEINSLPYTYEGDDASYADPQGLALWRGTNQEEGAGDVLLNLTVCLRSGLANTAAVLLYSGSKLSGALQPGSGGCKTTPYLRAAAGGSFAVAVVDDVMLEAILPLAAVRSVEMRELPPDATPADLPTFVQATSDEIETTAPDDDANGGAGNTPSGRY